MGAPPGERHGRARLTDKQVREIRARRSAGTTYLSLALEYDVSSGTVSAIVRGVTWRHLLMTEVPMPELDKWQIREAKQYAEDNSVSYEAAVKVLFPDDSEVPAEPVAEDTPDAKDAKVKVTK